MSDDTTTTSDETADEQAGGLDATVVEEPTADTNPNESESESEGVEAAEGDENPGLFANEPEKTETGDENNDSTTSTLGYGLGKAAQFARHAPPRAWDSFLYGLTSALGTDKIWQKRFKKTIKRMYKSTDADAIGFVATRNGEIIPTPVKYRPPDADVDVDDDDNNPHGYWEAGHLDQTFSAATAEVSTEHIKNVPVIFLDTDDWAEASFSGALLAEAVDMGHTDRLYQNPKFNVIELIQHPGDAADAPNAARTDGGAMGVQSKVRIENADPGQLDDVAIDVSSPGQLDGTRVLWEKFKDLRLDRTTVEEMNQVEQRGYLAGRVDAESDNGVGEIKWFILGMVALGLGGFWLGAKFGGGGGGGGGGGSVMPFMLSAGSALKSLAFGVGWL